MSLRSLIYKQAVKASAKKVVREARAAYPTLSNAELAAMLHATDWPGLGPQGLVDFAEAISDEIYK